MERYENWETQCVYIIPSLYWYNVERLVNNLHETRSYIMSSSDIKTKSRLLSLMSEHKLIQQTAPANKTTRFPNTAYLCEGIGNWHIHLDTLLLALHVMMDESAKKKATRMIQHLETMGQVEIFAIEKINLVLTSMADHLITRQQFEQLYGLNWVEREVYMVLLGYKVLVDESTKIFILLKQVDKMLHEKLFRFL